MQIDLKESTRRAPLGASAHRLNKSPSIEQLFKWASAAAQAKFMNRWSHEINNNNHRARACLSETLPRAISLPTEELRDRRAGKKSANNKLPACARSTHGLSIYNGQSGSSGITLHLGSREVMRALNLYCAPRAALSCERAHATRARHARRYIWRRGMREMRFKSR